MAMLLPPTLVSCTVTGIHNGSPVIHPFESPARGWLHQNNVLTSSNAISSASTISESSPLDLSNSRISQFLSQTKPRNDKVKRVIDSSTIQLTSGYVSLDTVRGAGSTYTMPECMDKAPAYKLKSLLPKGVDVKVYELKRSNGDGGPKRVWIVRSSDDLIINRELVKSGYAFVRRGVSNNIPGMINELKELEMNARRDGLGIFKMCSDKSDNTKESTNNNAILKNSDFIAEFEPLEYTTQTQWGDDGGKTVLVPKETIDIIPQNPGDIKGCSDFETFEEAIGWYETYYPYYGDVAKLDRRGMGVPCSGLPHTKNMDRYRMKRPNASVSNVPLNDIS